MATVEELQARQEEIKARFKELDDQYRSGGVEQMSEEHQSEWEALEDEVKENEKTLAEAEYRRKVVENLSENPANREEGAHFQVPKQRVKGEDIHDLTTIRGSVASPEAATRELRDRALTFIDRATLPESRFATKEEMQGRMEHLVNQHGDKVSARLLLTEAPSYRAQFQRYLATGNPSPELESVNERVGLLTSDAQGGYAVPTTVDPTVLPTSNGAVNPYRQIANVKTITGTDWQGVTSDGATAAFGTATTEATDNAPTLAAPTVTPARAWAFVPYSIEIGQDWGSLQSEIATMFQDAKDQLETTRFTLGTASTSDVEGVVKAGTANVATAGTAAFVSGDIYSVESALPPRFLPNASFIGHHSQFNRIRQFDTSGGSSLWARIGEGQPGRLLDHGAYEVSAMASTITTGSIILLIGDFNYFIIVDRVGLNVEVIPHLFGGTSRFPTGQRGLYAYWRTGSVVASVNAFRRLTAL